MSDVLCALADIRDPGAKGFRPVGRLPFFVVRVGDAVYGYVNACAHLGTPLDWRPDTFLSHDKALIQCSTHGAQFNIEDGVCVAGPCLGKGLEPLPLRIEDGMVCWDD